MITEENVLETDVELTKKGTVRKRKPKKKNTYFTEETEEAILQYTKFSDQFKTKDKYRTFNMFNLHSILDVVKKEEKTWKYRGPKTVHLS